MDNQRQQKRREFVEDFGILFESMGFPCMAGRIWGWLLTADPPQQTAAEIAEGVGASRGSISTITSHLIQFGFVERVGLPGKRTKYYRVKDGASERSAHGKSRSRGNSSRDGLCSASKISSSRQFRTP